MTGHSPHFGRRAPLAFHVTLRPADDLGVARHAADLRRAARIIHDQAASRGLFAFRLADTHAHLILMGDRATVGRVAQRIQVALRWNLALPAPFEPARVRPIVHGRHLANTLHYVLRQEERHGTDLDPAHDGSILPDLLGLRALGGDTVLRRVRLHLPRVTQDDLRTWVDLVEFERFEPHPNHLVAAAAAALALPNLNGNGPAACLARAAAAQALPLERRDLAHHLAIDPRSADRLRTRSVPPRLRRAVELQLRLRTALAHSHRAW